MVQNLAALIAADGKEDSQGTVWNFGSYYGDGENGYDCYEVKYREIVVIGTSPQKPAPGGGSSGGGSGGGSSQPPPKEERKPTENEIAAENFTTSDHERLKKCWEEKAKKLKKLEGWNTEATTAATWELDYESVYGFGKTEYEEKDEVVSITTQIRPLVIGRENNVRFNHLVIFTQMHETVHISQILADADDGDGRNIPAVYEWWDMEVEAHKLSVKWWRKIFKTPAPSYLSVDNAKKPPEYETNKTRYIDLKEKEAAGTLIKNDKVDEAAELEGLEKYFKTTAPEETAEYGYNYNKKLSCD